MMVLANRPVVILSQYIRVLNQPIIHLKLTQYVNYISVQKGRKSFVLINSFLPGILKLDILLPLHFDNKKQL